MASFSLKTTRFALMPGAAFHRVGLVSLSAHVSLNRSLSRVLAETREKHVLIYWFKSFLGSEWRINITEQQLLTNTEPGVERPPDVNGHDQRYTHVHGELKPSFYCSHTMLSCVQQWALPGVSNTQIMAQIHSYLKLMTCHFHIQQDICCSIIALNQRIT